MSKDTRFKKGQSGNPKGRPRKGHEQESNRFSYDVILDKRIATTANGKVEDLSLEEAIEQRLLKDALDGNVLAARKILKMIEKREAAINKAKARQSSNTSIELHHSSDNAKRALLILKIARPDERVGGCRWNIETWAAQAALSRPGRRKFTKRQKENIEFFTRDPHTLHWPKGRICDD